LPIFTNPASDATPRNYLSTIITERGIIYNIEKLYEKEIITLGRR